MTADLNITSDASRALLSLLRRDSILRASPGQPVVDRNGQTAPWMFYSWNFSLNSTGCTLAVRCLLECLSSFKSTQIGTFGTTALPLLSGCVLLSNGKYQGIFIRERPKGSEVGRQIEGRANPSKSVVMIDDSLSSGTSLLNGIRVLEQQGFLVEGAVCLVRFPHRGGRERLQALGYRVETLFDIWDDLGMPIPQHVPGYMRCGDFIRDSRAVEDGLSPVQVVRAVANHLLREGTLLLPPCRMDGDYSAPGGVWVSFRERGTDIRLARDGFWHFNAKDADVCRDIVLAAAKTVQAGALRVDQLEKLKVAVTFFGVLEPIRPSSVDFSEYGIVVRSLAWPTKVGGALPNTQVFTSEREQLDLARRNAGLSAFEPFELFRHSVSKHVESNERWLPYGVPDRSEYAWTEDVSVGQALTRHVFDVLWSVKSGVTDLPHADLSRLIKTPVAAVAVTLYRNGVVGCAISCRPHLNEAIGAATRAALEDKRFVTMPLADLETLVPVVSVLYDPEWLGWTNADRAANKIRLGKDSLSVQDGSFKATFLESVGVHFDWDKQTVALKLLEKARIQTGIAHWTTYRTASWLGGRSEAVRCMYGFTHTSADGCDASMLTGDLALLGRYIEANLLDSGLPCYAQNPITNWRWESGTAARVIHGLVGLIAVGECLDDSNWQDLGRAGIQRCLEAVELTSGRLQLAGQRCGAMGDCELVTAAIQAGLEARFVKQLNALSERIRSLLRLDGSIHLDGQSVRSDRDNDYLPNAVMLALASLGHADRTTLASSLEPYRAWQVRRFRLLRRWGQVGWLPQVCAAVFFTTGNLEYAKTAFEVVDWSLDWQVEKTGAFLTDLSSGGPTFHTAFVAEAVADAWRVAIALKDFERAETYERAWWAAVRFAHQLIIKPADAPLLPSPDRCIGGVRGTLNSSTIRIDYVSHLAIALSKGLRALAIKSPQYCSKESEAPENQLEGSAPSSN